mgnify:CR=1 FL=1
MADRPIDSHSGQETTGHEWDGIRELDTPLPRWWKWVFYATIVWSIGYWIAMPSWPMVSTFTKGVLGYSSRGAVMDDIAEARAAQSGLLSRIEQASLEQIRTDPALLEFALAGGRSAFAVNCVQCHGSGAAGNVGYPNLNDDEWLWGGSLQAIQHSITHGIRNETDEDARVSDMPAFLRDEVLTSAQVNDVTEYVLSLTNQAEDRASAARGQAIFAENCVSCHGDGGQGNAEFGAPALNNGIWLYGGDRETIRETVAYSRRGVMPAWGQIIDEATVKKLTIYVHSLGGGQ